MKKLDKLIKIDKRLLVFLMVLLIVGIISGAILLCIINNSDKLIIKEYLTNYINAPINHMQLLKNNLFNYISIIIVVWLLGMSVIGLPIILIIYFFKTFLLGFSISSILFTFGFKGSLFAFIYILPSQIIYLLILTILMMYSISFSLRLIETFLKKKTVSFNFFNKYLIILGIVIFITILISLYDTYIMPLLIKKIIGLLV